MPRITTNIVLMGMKHCGKTTLGAMLARRLSREFFDLDRVVEGIEAERLGRPVTAREIYRLRGKEAFQALEERALREILGTGSGGADGVVVALGGGTIENGAALAILREAGILVFLDEDEEVLFRRIEAGGLPPFLEGSSPRESFHDLYEKRTSLYRERADLRVDLRGLGPGEGLDRLLELL